MTGTQSDDENPPGANTEAVTPGYCATCGEVILRPRRGKIYCEPLCRYRAANYERAQALATVRRQAELAKKSGA